MQYLLFTGYFTPDIVWLITASDRGKYIIIIIIHYTLMKVSIYNGTNFNHAKTIAHVHVQRNPNSIIMF